MAIQDAPARQLRVPERPADTGVSIGAAVLALATPLLFLHVDFQPSLEIGSAGNGIRLSDLAVLAVGVAALAAGLRSGFGRLRAGLAVWVAAAALCAWAALTIALAAGDEGYGLGANAATWAKLVEYTTLAAAVPLLARTARELRLLFAAIALWAAVAAAVAVAQFLGAGIFDAWRAGYRQPSFLGHLDFAALAVCALAVGVAGLAAGGDWRRPRWLVPLAAAGGGLGLVLSATVAGAGGLVAGAAVATAAATLRFGLRPRRLLAVAAFVGVVCVGVVAFRGGDLDQFLRFSGVRAEEASTSEDVQTYAHRTVLVYIGLRIFADHPLVGVGWQGSGEERAFGPYLDDARARFPDVAEEAFPAPGREWGVQNAYVQALADLGAPGLLLWLAPFAAALWLAWSAARRLGRGLVGVPLTALAALLSLLGVWAAQGLVQGAPLAAASWLMMGVAAAAAASARTDLRAGGPRV